MRDFQRQRNYTAEWATGDLIDMALKVPGRAVTFKGSTVVLNGEERFANIDEVEAYLTRAMFHPGVVARFGARRVPRISERRQKNAHYSLVDGIVLPQGRMWAFRELVVLHELAHYLAPGGHGPEWADAFLYLIEQMMSAEIAWVHRVNMHESGVVTA